MDGIKDREIARLKLMVDTLDDAFKAAEKTAELFIKKSEDLQKRVDELEKPASVPSDDELPVASVGNLPTLNQDDYPGLGSWWVQIWLDSHEVLARVYGDSPEQAHKRAAEVFSRINAAQGNAATKKSTD